jgi:hypothetical protein
MGGGDQPYSAYQTLPTNLQHYTGGTGSPALLNQDQQQGSPGAWGGYAPQISPYQGSPYGFMGGMGQNFGTPMAAPMMDYNAMAGQMAGPMPEPIDHKKAIKKARKRNDQIRKLQRQLANLRKKQANSRRNQYEAGGGGSDSSGGAAAGGERGGDPTGGGGSGVDGR